MKLSLLSLVLPLSVVVATPCTFPGGDECGDEQYCAIEAGQCALRSMQSGTCAAKGTMACPMIFAPVCGCDMNTYVNDCSAAAAGVNVLTEGSCADAEAETCTFPGGDECGDDQYCAIEAGKCALRSMQSGTCASKGTRACPMIFAQVCGCDNNTYDNDCLAGAVGVNVIAEGPCDTSADTNAGTSTDTSADNPPVAGGDYCTWSPDDSCYMDGRPQCCLEEDQPCPPDRQPRCDNHGGMSGWDYCTYSPDSECYASGWPACCGRFDGTNCPSDQPNCDAPGMEATFPLGAKMAE